MDNSASVELTQADFLKFLDTEKIAYEKVDLTPEAEEEKGEKKEEKKEDKKEKK